MDNEIKKLTNLVYLGLIILSLIPWAFLQHQISISGDSAFLFLGAEKLFSGLEMSEHFYDNNPPLSFALYGPALLLKNLGFSIHNALQLYTLIIFSLSIISSFLILQKTPGISNNFKITATVAIAFLCTVFFVTEFSLKDHFIIIALFPFILTQNLLTQKALGRTKAKNLFLFPLIFFFGIFLYIKPHYGIIPIFMIVRRAIQTRSIKSCFMADFWILATLCILYICATIVFTPDYIFEILPYSIDIYATSNPTRNIVPQSASFILLAIVIITFACFLEADATQEHTQSEKKLTFEFGVISFLSIIPFILQNKGFYGHFLPSLCLLIFTASLIIGIYCQKNIRNQRLSALIIILGFSIIFNALLLFPNSAVKKNNLTYPNSTFAQTIEKYAQNKTFFIEAYSTHLFWKHAAYNPFELSSRFPSLWFLIDFDLKSYEVQHHLWQRFGNMMAADMNRKPPDILLLRQPETKDGGFYNLFIQHPDLGKILKLYEFTGIKMTINKRHYGILFEKGDDAQEIYHIYEKRN